MDTSTRLSNEEPHLPLEGLLVLDFSQFLAGPSAALRLADLGATVIKIERPDGGDLSRRLYVSNLKIDGDSTLFHTINRNKQSFAADLKNPDDLVKVRKLIESADVMIQNFRPGIIERLGLGYDDVKEFNPRIVYASISGYGNEGPWKGKPGQDLLVQSLSGLAWMSGDADKPPVATGVAVADMMTGAHLVQGILAALVRRGVSGKGSRVDVSLMESILDLQFEFFSTFLNDNERAPVRSGVCSASAYLAAPYGIYPTRDGFLALAMMPIQKLAEMLESPELGIYAADPDTWFSHRDLIKSIIRDCLSSRSTADWLALLEPADIWCAEVMDWPTLVAHDGFKALDMIQNVFTASGERVRTTRCPIRFDGRVLRSSKGAPKVGEDNAVIQTTFNL
ncbi:CaiB/BaiF CoA transferase family protein [Phytopseudomonas daroniae]|uniref:CaiB/BaiF CoA transferase family protein n=1 Tax=Phytopseudomonas daroniae TaxID=2487519 RepID=UPI0010385537|nr:CaiB/BaiF CoA-transferase family protein [Pseudomonas daroniae]TBU76999.1 CoA transferase [Pseudomonas daroniae]